MKIDAESGYWESFDDLDGLMHGCRCLLEDKQGHIWVGSRRRGLCRYDGKKFTSPVDGYALVDNHIQCIYEDRARNIWIGTKEHGIFCYDGKKFANFTNENGLVDNNVRCIYQDREGKIWAGTRRRLSWYDGNGFVSFSRDDLPIRNVRSIYQDKEGDIWIGTSRGLSRYDGEEFTFFNSEDGWEQGFINCIYQDREGNLWIGMRENGIRYYDRKKFVNITDKYKLINRSIQCIYQDTNDNIWIGTDGGGAYYYNGQEFVNFTTEHGLTGNAIYDIIEDREGSIWFACHHGGITRYDPYQISLISDESVDEAIMKDKYGTLWWGSGTTLSQYKERNVKHHHSFDNIIYELFEDSKGQLWVGTNSADGNVFGYDDIENVEGRKFWKLVIGYGFVEHSIVRIYEDEKGNIWIGTDIGVYCYDGIKFTNFMADNGMENRLISAIFQDSSGTLWLGGWDGGGIITYDGKSIHKYTTEDGLTSDEVICIMEDIEGNIWIGTSAGISVYNGRTFRNYSAEDGLLGTCARRILQDSKGQIWIAMLGGGVSRFDGKNFQVLTSEDGLPSNNVTGIIEDADGSMIISTYKGICRYTPKYDTPPLVQIDTVDADRIYKQPEEMQISENVSSLRIRYHALSFKTKRIRYNYILEGYENDWKSTWDTEARYENLPVGEYTFKIIAINRDLVYSETPAELKLTVTNDPRDQVIDDLTEELRESEMQYSATINSIDDAIHVVDTDLRFVLCNNAFRNLSGELGYKADPTGQKLFDLFPFLTDKVKNEYQQVINTGEPLITEENIKIGDISFNTETRKMPIREAGKVIRVITIVRDITEKRRMEEELLQVQKLESIGILAGGIAHDLNNLLTAIVGNISMAEMDAQMGREPEMIMKRLGEAEKASMRVKDLTQQLLTFSKGGAPVKQLATINEFLKDSATFALRGSNVKGEFSIPDNIWSAEIDEGQINQVINNLVINADQAMPDGGILAIKAENIILKTEHGLPLQSGTYIKISIEDKGTGIPERHLKKIFDPFFTTKQKGNGLGLATSYSIIRKHGGHIAVESQLGVGTIFHIYLPASPDQAMIESRKNENRPVTGSGRILIMDDEECILDMATQMLGNLGYVVVTTVNGSEAIAAYKESVRSGEKFDAIITDLTVPGGMGGREVIQRLLEIDPDIKVIVSSGYSNAPVLSDFRNYGFKGTIAKPYRLKELSEVLHQVITENI